MKSFFVFLLGEAFFGSGIWKWTWDGEAVPDSQMAGFSCRFSWRSFLPSFFWCWCPSFTFRFQRWKAHDKVQSLFMAESNWIGVNRQQTNIWHIIYQFWITVLAYETVSWYLGVYLYVRRGRGWDETEGKTWMILYFHNMKIAFKSIFQYYIFPFPSISSI